MKTVSANQTVRDNYGALHRVLEVRDNIVYTNHGPMHITKVWPI